MSSKHRILTVEDEAVIALNLAYTVEGVDRAVVGPGRFLAGRPDLSFVMKPAQAPRVVATLMGKLDMPRE
jgi:hypothetical protein